MLLEIVDSTTQIVVIGAAGLWLTCIEDCAVAQRGLLYDVERHLAPLPAVALQRFERRAAQDRDKLLRKIECVVNAAVEAHTAERVVDMRRITGNQHAAF